MVIGRFALRYSSRGEKVNMKKLVMPALALILCLQSHAAFIVTHYNIKELTTEKLDSPENEQVKNVRKVMKKLGGDILSLNEVQFDLPGVPTEKQVSKGQNLYKIARVLGDKSLRSQFYQANTGNNAERTKSGDYVSQPNSPQGRELADKVNFGVFPGQYSTGALSRYQVLRTKVYADLKWRDFNPNLDLSSYTDASGKALPEDMELFDKNFTDVVYEIDGREVHVILFHTVPAFGFGNKKSVNFLRNEEQLKFLEWYLTGKTDFSVPQNLGIEPLKSRDSFVAVGDWNVDLKIKKEGALVLERLFQKYERANKTNKPTYVGQGFAPKGFQAQFDYLIVSPDLRIIQGGVYSPDAKRKELGCGKKGLSQKFVNAYHKVKGRVVTYKKDGLTCRARVSNAWYQVKKASDHLPLTAIIDFKN
jgi:endonuclease/exonuclease/phosphatase family metal-dependent hydrolase